MRKTIIFALIKYLLVLFLGIAIGAIPIYNLAERALKDKKFFYAVALTSAYADVKTGNVSAAEHTLEKFTSIIYEDIKSSVEDVPWEIECWQVNLMNQKLMIENMKKAGKDIDPLCHNTLDELYARDAPGVKM